jgi:hypothetical protein
MTTTHYVASRIARIEALPPSLLGNATFLKRPRKITNMNPTTTFRARFFAAVVLTAALTALFGIARDCQEKQERNDKSRLFGD